MFRVKQASIEKTAQSLLLKHRVQKASLLHQIQEHYKNSPRKLIPTSLLLKLATSKLHTMFATSNIHFAPRA
jgi:hypothetical protein